MYWVDVLIYYHNGICLNYYFCFLFYIFLISISQLIIDRLLLDNTSYDSVKDNWPKGSYNFINNIREHIKESKDIASHGQLCVFVFW